MSEPQILQTIRLTLDSEGETNRWTDTGMTIGAGDVLRVRCEGRIALRGGDGRVIIAYPEGVYAYGATVAEHENAPAYVLPYSSLDIGDSSPFLANNLPPFALAIDVFGNTTPQVPVVGALRPNRDTTFTPSQLNGGSRVRVAMNRNPAGARHVTKVSGIRNAWDITLDRIAAPDLNLPQGTVSPIRLVPPGLLAIKRSVRQKTAWCWFIQPRVGAAEAYTSWNRVLDCPEYNDATGIDDDGNFLYSTTPAALYRPNHAVDLTQIPTAIKLGIDAPDIDMMNFDRVKLLSGYYEGAEVEVFEVAPNGDLSERLVHLVGTLGAADVDILRATIELTPLEELANRSTGARVQPFCDVGRLIGETFGRGRCRNSVLNDGPDIAQHTRGARIVSFDSLSKLTLAPQAVGGFAAYETGATSGKPAIYASGFPASHGSVIFKSGTNTGVTRDSGRFNAATGVLVLRRALPFLPAIGDTMLLEAGCNRTPQMCRQWGNMNNFRGFEFVPGRAAVRRTYTG